jgi:hypothetical protein
MRKPLGFVVIIRVVTFAIRRGVHRHVGKQVVKTYTAVREEVESRALAFAISHMADEMGRAFSASLANTKSVQTAVKPESETGESALVAHSMSGLATTTASSETVGKLVELADEVDELPKR